MKNIFRIIAVVVLTTVLSLPAAMAGNDNRRGTAGATELLINPWARSAGWGSVNTACARGIDAFYMNVAGLSFIEKNEVAYSNTLWLGGKSGLSSAATINAFALGLRLFDKGVLGLYVMAMNFGDIEVTSYNSPEGGNNGTFSPSVMNLNVAYAHSFTKSIHGGFNLKVISESTADISGTGIGLDAGIQYVTGEDDELKFGISLKNIGPAMSFSGTSFSFQFVNANDNNMTAEYRSGEIELPTCFNIGISYDFLIDKWDQRVTLAGNFTSNAFLKDNFVLGLEYSLLNRVQLRAGYVYQNDIFSSANRTTANTGLAVGGSVNIPLSEKNNTAIVLDYAYRSANPMKGSHSIGASLKF